jgi:glucuronosyltransferase
VFRHLILLVACLAAFYLQHATCDKILAIFAFPGKSHGIMLNTVTEELARRGHEVTIITNYPASKKIANYTEIIIDPIYDYWANAPAQNLFDLTEMSFTEMMLMLYYGIGIPTTEHALQNKAVQELIQREGNHFDLILAEQFFQEAFLMLAHKYKAPIVTAGER